MDTSFRADRRKKILLAIFLLLWLFMAAGLGLLYSRLAGSAGLESAVVFVGIVFIGLVILFLITALGTFALVLAVRNGWFAPAHGSLMHDIINGINRWSPPYDVRPILNEPDAPSADEDSRSQWLKDFTDEDLDQMMEFILHRKGRGRKSDTPDDRRFSAVRDWIKMQMHGTSVRKQDFLEERFGTHVDGSPKVPVDTFNGWQSKFKKMLLEYKSRNQK